MMAETLSICRGSGGTPIISAFAHQVAQQMSRGLRVELAYWSRIRAAIASSRASAEVSSFLFAAVLLMSSRRVGKSGLRDVGGAAGSVSTVLSSAGVHALARTSRLSASNSVSVQPTGWYSLRSAIDRMPSSVMPMILCDKSNEERRRNKAEIPCNMVSLPVLSKEAYRGGSELAIRNFNSVDGRSTRPLRSDCRSWRSVNARVAMTGTEPSNVSSDKWCANGWVTYPCA